MPLAEPAEREPVQTRTIEVSSFRRRDGRWDVEGRLVDIAAHSFPDYAGGMVEAGTPIHDMRIRLTLNAEVDIVAVDVAMDAHPYPVCPGIVPAFQTLRGVRIGRGWNRRVREMFSGVKGCVHLVDLLGPVGTIGFKTVQRESGQDDRPAAVSPAAGIDDRPGAPAGPAAEKADDRPYQVNSCHALASEGELVRFRWPELYTGSS